eukprot:Skav216604  [mRNA]  locus=scaffold2855:412873:414750:+ [translate_table: standard]
MVSRQLSGTGCAGEAEDGRILWTLAADEMKTDEQHLQVSLDPLVPFKATFHASHLALVDCWHRLILVAPRVTTLCRGHLPPHLPGGSAMPLPEAGGVFHLEAAGAGCEGGDMKPWVWG